MIHNAQWDDVHHGQTWSSRKQVYSMGTTW